MNSVTFEEVNIKIAEHQEEYNTVHANVQKVAGVNIMTACYELTGEEIQDIMINKKIWYQQCIGEAMQPMIILTTKPKL